LTKQLTDTLATITDPENVVAHFAQRKLLISYPIDSGQPNDETLVLDFAAGPDSWYKLGYGFRSICSYYGASDNNELMVVGLSDTNATAGYLYEIEKVGEYDFLENTFERELTTIPTECDYPYSPKKFYGLLIELGDMPTAQVNFEIIPIVDGVPKTPSIDFSVTNAGSLTQHSYYIKLDSSTYQFLTGGTISFNIKIEPEGGNASDSIAIRRLAIDVEPMPFQRDNVVP